MTSGLRLKMKCLFGSLDDRLISPRPSWVRGV